MPKRAAPPQTAPLIIAPSPLPLFAARFAPTQHPRLREAKLYTRVRHGVYALTSSWTALMPWERYLARVHAFALQHPGAVFAFESAAALRGLPIFGEPRDVHVFDTARSSSRRYGDVCVHTSQDHRTVDAGLFAVTSAADTTLDLLRVLPPAFGLAVVDAVVSIERGGTSTNAQLRDLAASQANARGRAKIAWALDRADGLAESAGESVSRAVIEWCGFAEPVLQQEFRYEGSLDRSDFYWPTHRIVGESDGYGKYRAGTAEESEKRLLAEKKREDRLRRYESGFARWDFADAMSLRIREKLTLAGVPQVSSEQPGMLATLRQNPRSAPSRGRFRPVSAAEKS